MVYLKKKNCFTLKYTETSENKSPSFPRTTIERRGTLNFFPGLKKTVNENQNENKHKSCF